MATNIASGHSGSTSNIHSNAFPSINPLDQIRIAIADEVARIAGVDPSLVFDGLDRTATLDTGDLLLAVPRLRIKNTSPKDLATKIASEFNIAALNGRLQPPVADGIYVRFFLNPSQIASNLLPFIFNQKETYGFNKNVGLDDASKQKRMIVEFSSPNIAKKFHAGHLRSTIIGAFLSNLYESSGYAVIRMNYLGDWGRQYGLLACGWKRWGDEDIFAKNPIGHLFDIYVKISAAFKPEEEAYRDARKRNEDTSVLESQGILGEAKAYFKRMEAGDEEALNLWRRFRALSIEKYKETYARLNISFDEYSGESHVLQETMTSVEAVLDKRGLTEPFEGASMIAFKKHGAPKLNDAIIRNRNGTSNYLLRDIGAAIQRDNEFHMDQMYYVVMSEQETHLNRLFKTLELMGDEYTTLSKKLKHITYGRITGMSSRRGTVKFLDDIITDVSDFMHDVMRKNEEKYAQIENPARTAEILGISAIMVQDMSGKKINDYEFDLDRMTSFEGDTGPYLQYAHARLSSILRRSNITENDMLEADLTCLANTPHAVTLLRIMVRWPDIVVQTLKTLEPTTILTYLFKLAHELSSSYDHLRVVNAVEGRQVSVARAALFFAARQVLQNGMRVLGLTPLDRM